jgi:chromosomal replication initiation ATPase DnaA
MQSPGIMASNGPKNALRNEPTQLALALDHAESLAREDFLAGPSNADALSLIERWPDWPGRTVLLRGPEGSGKSHLAAIWARAAGARTLSPRSLVGAEVPVALATGALVLENLAEDGFDESALFHLLNLAREERAYVLITARSAPSGWRVGLPDLASRLRALPVVALTAPDDTLLRAVIVKLFADRQLAVDEGLIGYVATRIERSFAAARTAVGALDREALRLKRPVSRALAGELFREP